MPDYSACANPNCVRALSCARWMMRPDPFRQSYLLVEDWENCTAHMPIEDAPFALKEEVECSVCEGSGMSDGARVLRRMLDEYRRFPELNEFYDAVDNMGDMYDRSGTWALKRIAMGAGLPMDWEHCPRCQGEGYVLE